MSLPDRHVFVCTSDHCCKRGAKKVCKTLKQVVDDRGMKRKIKVLEVDCLNQCGHGPMAIVYPDATWYADLKPSDVEEVVDRHLTAGKPVTEKLFRKAHGPHK